MNETEVNCPDCGRVIYYGNHPRKDMILKSCCVPSTVEGRSKFIQAKYNSDRYKAQRMEVATHEEKLELIMAHIVQYRDYLSRNIYDKVKSKVGCYRTFNRMIKELVESDRLEQKKYGFIRLKEVGELAK